MLIRPGFPRFGQVRAFHSALRALEPNKKSEGSKLLPVKMLSHPLGVKNKPDGKDPHYFVDERTWSEWGRDVKDKEKHMKKRKELMEEFGESRFRDMKELRQHNGKQWLSPAAFFRAEKSLYMPNFLGRTLEGPQIVGTTDTLKGKVSIVRMFTSVFGEEHARSYVTNADRFLDKFDLVQNRDFQIVNMNIPENKVKSWMLSWYAKSMASKCPPEERKRYFVIEHLGKIMRGIKNAIGHTNVYTGYVYVVDQNCRIRWAASGLATETDRETLWKTVRALSKNGPDGLKPKVSEEEDDIE